MVVVVDVEGSADFRAPDGDAGVAGARGNAGRSASSPGAPPRRGRRRRRRGRGPLPSAASRFPPRPPRARRAARRRGPRPLGPSRRRRASPRSPRRARGAAGPRRRVARRESRRSRRRGTPRGRASWRRGSRAGPCWCGSSRRASRGNRPSGRGSSPPRRPRGRSPSRAAGRRPGTPRASPEARRGPRAGRRRARRSATEARTTSSNQARAMSLTAWGSVSAVVERWKVPFVVASSPPTMSMWIPATSRRTISGCRTRYACEPAISGSHRKRIVRRGGDSFRLSMPDWSARAISRIAALPEALSLAPADSWQRCAVRTTSPAEGSLPGIVATTTSKVAGTIFAATRERRVIFSPRARRARSSSACRFESMKAKRLAVWYGDRCPHRTRSRSSPDQAVVWLGKSERNPAAPRSSQARRCTSGRGPSARTIFPLIVFPS